MVSGKKVGVHGTDKETGRNNAKTKCELSREEFLKSAPNSIKLVIDDKHTIMLEKKVFATGSLGYHAPGKIQMDICQISCKLQGNLMLIIVGSKEV